MALIYIIEDDDSIREIEEFALINAGHKVLGFACARDFYRRLDDVIPDLCLVDIMLPDESGNEIVRKLRKNPDTKNIPVIMVTAKTTEMDLVRGHEVTVEGRVVELTFKEYELLSLFLVNKGIVLSRDTIMDKVWGTDYEGESRTIDMHVKTLRQKLGNYGNRIRTIRNVGYVIE